MTEVIFDAENNSWNQTSEYSRLVWGFQKSSIGPLSHYTPGPSFSVKPEVQTIFPLVGILSAPAPGGFTGNKPLFKAIQQLLQKEGGMSFVFTPTECMAKQIDGYFYSFYEKKWVSATFPAPNIVYNRTSIRESEKTPSFLKTIQWLRENSIPFFNPSFFTKWDLYSVLKENTFLAKHLPFTILVDTEEDFTAFLKQYRKVIAKPINGSKGDGIFSISLLDNHSSLIETHANKASCGSAEEIWKKLNELFRVTPYILQEKIALNTIGSRPYDFRILVQRPDKNWNITGIGVRCGKPESITTHVPMGGKILPLHTVNPPVDEEIVSSLAKAVGTTLEDHFGLIGEFSMDIGRDSSNHYWIFEANAKPMRFDERTIYNRSLQNLTDTFRSFAAT
ncbi:YheC/YheD family protein [Pseudalkalibacillus caeni]|uniref:YheC/YheD family protein n=1 Tax=Exobacillus caeni TaxID=2574798 RepID=A0A5R9F8S9_9BACL|nr:YheC/YheD family protein [Pseudalkalibacillus caeni]TLS38028.1 YheC/YheD family protein [Pseudalkalibacillus caeni]